MAGQPGFESAMLDHLVLDFITERDPLAILHSNTVAALRPSFAVAERKLKVRAREGAVVTFLFYSGIRVTHHTLVGRRFTRMSRSVCTTA